MPFGFVILHDGFTQLRLDRLGQVQRARLGVSRHHAQTKGHGRIGAKKIRRVAILPEFRLRLHPDLVIPIRRHALRKRHKGPYAPSGLSELVVSYNTM